MKKLTASISILIYLLEAQLLPEATPRLSENLTYFLDAEAVVFCVFIAGKRLQSDIVKLLVPQASIDLFEHTLCATLCCHWMLRPNSHADL